MAAAGQPSGEQPARPRSAAPLLAREEEYRYVAVGGGRVGGWPPPALTAPSRCRRLNAALEAKAAAVMRQAEELMVSTGRARQGPRALAAGGGS